MLNFSEQFIAKNDNGGGWMQLLVFIVLGVFWVVGGILKAKSQKVEKEEEEGEEPPQPTTEGPRRPQRRTYRSIIQEMRGGKVVSQLPKKIKIQPPQTSPDRERKPISAPLKVAKAEDSGEALFDFEMPQDWRKAILYYEILGKPLALRNE